MGGGGLTVMSGDHVGWVFSLCVDVVFHSEADGSMGRLLSRKVTSQV